MPCIASVLQELTGTNAKACRAFEHTKETLLRCTATEMSLEHGAMKSLAYLQTTSEQL